MIERPRTHSQEAAEETGNRYLANLGLEWAELRGKKVLDVGALNAEFEHAARLRGVDVISLDMGVADDPYMPPADSRFVVAKATKLPFKGESFDYALAHMSVMNYLEEHNGKEGIEAMGYREEEYLRYIEDVLREACRVLKSGGEFRFMTSPDWDALRKGVEASDVSMENERHLFEEIVKRAGFRELQLKKYKESQRTRPEGDEDFTHYYIALK